jgi:hypothetical protein
MVGQMRTYNCRWLAVIPVRRTVPRVAMFGTGFGFIGYTFNRSTRITRQCATSPKTRGSGCGASLVKGTIEKA